MIEPPNPFSSLSRDRFMADLARAGLGPEKIQEIVERWKAYWEQDPFKTTAKERDDD